jgi:hypothetical protein
MVASSKLRPNVWNLPLDFPIEVDERGSRLATLGDVAAFILALPETPKRREQWEAAAATVIEAAKSGDTTPVTLAVSMALILSGQNACSV